MFAITITRPTIYWLCASVVIAVVFYVVGQIGSTPRTSRATSTNDIATCVSRNLSEARQGAALAEGATAQAVFLCREMTVATLLADEQIIRNETMILQRDQNAAMLALVVIITISGVILAGLQLVASFYIAKAGQSEVAKDTEFSVKSSEFSLKSSYVGVVILGLSLVFFVVFVLFVYRIEFGSVSAPKPLQDSNTGVMLKEPKS